MDMKTVGIVVMVVALAFTIYMEVQKRTTIGKLETYLARAILRTISRSSTVRSPTSCIQSTTCFSCA